LSSAPACTSTPERLVVLVRINAPAPVFRNSPLDPLTVLPSVSAKACVSTVAAPFSVNVLASVRLSATARSVVPPDMVTAPEPSAVLRPTPIAPCWSSVPPR